MATANVSLPQRDRNLFPRKNRCVQFDCVNESQASIANHRRETVHLDVIMGSGTLRSLANVQTSFSLEAAVAPRGGSALEDGHF